jgi:hypothetical protein
MNRSEYCTPRSALPAPPDRGLNHGAAAPSRPAAEGLPATAACTGGGSAAALRRPGVPPGGRSGEPTGVRGSWPAPAPRGVDGPAVPALPALPLGAAANDATGGRPLKLCPAPGRHRGGGRAPAGARCCCGPPLAAPGRGGGRPGWGGSPGRGVIAICGTGRSGVVLPAAGAPCGAAA